MLQEFRGDLGYAFRTILRRPGFAAVVVLTFALGIGANTAVFSVIDSVLFRPLPYPAAERLVALWPDGVGTPVGPATFAAVRERSRTTEDVAAWSSWSFTLTGDGEAEVVRGARVTTNLPELLAAVPRHGRNFLEEESLPWAGPAYAGGSAALLSFRLWQRRYGGDPTVVGRTITVDGMAVPVVGVLPETFGFPDPGAEIWLPIAVSPSEEPSGGGAYRLIGRLREGVSPDQAVADVRGLALALRDDFPDRFGARYGEAADVLPLRDDLVGSTRQTLLLLFGAVGFVLLVACANVANLFLARAAERTTEMSIRAALGAGRWRLMRQLLTENAVFAALGALIGILVANWGAELFARALPANLTGIDGIGLNGRVLAFTAVVTVAAGLLSGLAPSLRSTRRTASIAAGGSSRAGTFGRDRHRLLESIVVAEFAIALVLVVGAGLVLQSFYRLSQQDIGFQAEGVLTFRASAPESFYPRAAQREQLTASILDRVGALPGVLDAGAIHLLPLGGANWGNTLEVEGRPIPAGDEGPSVAWRVVTRDYFRTIGVPLLAGRSFTAADRADAAAVAVVSETLARAVFPGEDPIGQRVRTGFDGERWATIVGVVGDTKDLDLAGATVPQIYRPYAQYALAGMTYVVRTAGDPMALATAAREVVADLDPNVPVSEIQSLEEVVSRSIAEPRLLMILLGAFGAVALVLAAIGIFGVISFAVGQRRREFGIRLALGARPTDLVRQVVRGAAKLAAIGLLIGMVGSSLVTGFIERSLYEVQPRDFPTFVAVAVLLGAVALFGSYLPARRAGRVDLASSLTES